MLNVRGKRDLGSRDGKPHSFFLRAVVTYSNLCSYYYRASRCWKQGGVPSLQDGLTSQWQKQRWVSGSHQLQTGLQLVGHQPDKAPGRLQCGHQVFSTILSLHRSAPQGLGYWLMLLQPKKQQRRAGATADISHPSAGALSQCCSPGVGGGAAFS